MEYIKRFPLILSMFMSILIGIISHIEGVTQKDIYTRLLICLVLFYLLGLFIRKNIEKLYNLFLQKKNTDDVDDVGDVEAGIKAEIKNEAATEVKNETEFEKEENKGYNEGEVNV